MKKVNLNRPRTRTTKEISADYSMVDPRHTRKRSTQTTISLSSFSLKGPLSPAQTKSLLKEAEQVARRYTRATQRLLDIKVHPSGFFMHVVQPQLAVHLGEHFAQAYKQFRPSTSVAWSRDTVNKVVEVKVEFHSVQVKGKLQSNKKAQKNKAQTQELHKWDDWYAWQEKQQAKKRSSE